MKKISIFLIYILIAVLLTGCSSLLQGLKDKDEEISTDPVETFEVEGTILEKGENLELVVATSVVTGKIKVSEAVWNDLQAGDKVTAVITTDRLINIYLNSGENHEAVVSSEGFNYETEGYIGDKIEDEGDYFIRVAGSEVSGAMAVSEEFFEQVEIGQKVKIYANLNGIHSVVVEEEEENEPVNEEDNDADPNQINK